MDIPAAAVFDYAWMLFIAMIGFFWNQLNKLSGRVAASEQSHAMNKQRIEQLEKVSDERWSEVREDLREIKNILLKQGEGP